MKAVYAFCTDRNGPDSYDFADCEPQAELVDKASGMRQIKSQVFLADLQADLLNLKRRTPRKPSIRLRFQVLQRDNFTCRACGRSPATGIGVVLEVDHIFAWSRGGETILANLQTLCDQCNSGKSDS
jgi:5-methylcytosine-specific restriction endonuclease McrA